MNILEVKQAIADSSHSTKVYIGCDSKVTRRKHVKFCTVVILHIDGKHGGHIFSKIETEKFYGSKKLPSMRLMQEVQKVVEMGWELQDVIGDRHFEVHLDLNTSTKFKSNSVVKEACGYVLGCLNITPKLKPEAFAASSAADALVQ